MARDVLNFEFSKDWNSPDESSSLLERNVKKSDSPESSNSGEWVTDLLENLAPVSSVLHSSEDGDYDVTRPSRNVLIRRVTNGYMSSVHIMSMLSMSFAWGYAYTIITLATLYLEYDILEAYFPVVNRNTECIITNSNTSTFFAMLILLAGITQIFNPLVGKLSDSTIPRGPWGKRKPFILAGGVLSAASLTIALVSSYYERWIIFGLTYFFFMIFVNIAYSVMMTLISDLVPISQIAQANGILICLMLSGGLFGFVSFYIIDEQKTLGESLNWMYLVDISMIVLSTIATVVNVKEQTYPTPSNECSEFDHLVEEVSPLLQIFGNARKYMLDNSWKGLLHVYIFTPGKYGDFFYVTLSGYFFYMGVVSAIAILTNTNQYFPRVFLNDFSLFLTYYTKHE